MTLEKIKSIRQFYGGQDVLLLIGGSLYSYSNDLTANARHFLQYQAKLMPQLAGAALYSVTESR